MLLIAYLLAGQISLAADANGLGPTFKTGYVFARGVLLGENGQPILAEYDDQGQMISQLGELVGDLEGARIISAEDYRFQYGRYLDFEEEYERTKAKAAKLLTREQYLQAEFGSVTLPDLNGDEGATVEVQIEKPVLGAGIQSVLVRDEKTIVTRDIAENDLILFSSKIDLDDAKAQLGADNQFSDTSTRTLVLNSAGQIIDRSSADIGYRTAFWNRQDGNLLTNTELDGNRHYRGGDTPVAPISQALVYPDMQWNSTGYTDENGQFSLYYFLPPCPGFTWFYDYNLIGEIPYRNFNPKSRAWQPWSVYYTTVPVGDVCDGTALNFSTATDLTGQSVYNTLVGINASRATPIVSADMPVLANMLTGIGMLSNDGETPVELGERTEYTVNSQTANSPALPTNLDLDADKKPDDIRIGDDGTVEVRFNADSEEADFTRLADTQPDFSSQGLLKTLNPEDLSDTDIYVYRQSTGELLVDREGLKNEEFGIYNSICAETDPDCIADGEDPTNRFFYQMLIRGRWYYDYLAGGLEDYQSKTRINEDLRGLDSNHLRAGEAIKLVAINRKTGYIGTAVANVKAGGVQNNALSFDIPPLMLQPPNLKIEARRTLEVEAGLTKGEERKYTIGSEGAGLTSDKTAVVTTEWIDQDGTPLPEDLPGYTGRLAQIIDTNELGAPTSSLSNFAIRPGRRTQIIRLTEDDVLGREHFYIHVSGEPVDGNPSFAKTQGAGEGLLQFRPDHYVPIRVPIFDEEATREARNQLRYAQKEELTELEIDDIDAIYQWPHRPEMHFSVFDLNVNKIAALDKADNDTGDEIQTIIYDPNSLDDCERDSETLLLCFLNNADAISFDYDLFGNPNDPLPAVGPDRTLVLSLGGEEVTIGPQYGADQTIRFEDPEHLRHLDTADYLTIALFQNNDAENLLWEFDLVKAALVVDANRDGVIQLDDEEDDATVSVNDDFDRGLPVFMSSALAQDTSGVANITRDVNSKEKPFRFWYNDDDDSGEVSQKGLTALPSNSDIPGKKNLIGTQTGPVYIDLDYENDVVDGMRDLIDFFPVFLDIKQTLENFSPVDYEYRLSHQQGALRYVQTDFELYDKSKNNDMLTHDSYMKFPEVAKEYSDSESIEITARGVKISENFLYQIRDNDKGVILVEAMDTGFDDTEDFDGRSDCEGISSLGICQPLEIRIFRKRPAGGRPVPLKEIDGRARLHLSIRGVEKMFRHINIRNAVGDPEISSDVPSRTESPDNYPDTTDDDSYLVWMSGYNVDEQATRGWQSEIFKRFYSLGVTSRFVGMTWAGDVGSLPFAKAIYRALQSSERAKETLLEVTRGNKTTVLAHSAGNLVMSNAIAKHAYTPTNYVMLDGAVSIQAYDSDQKVGTNGGEMLERMTEESWRPYLPFVETDGLDEFPYLLASNWYRRFPETDERSNLKWADRFEAVFTRVNTYNFYSSGEDVVESAFANESFLSVLAETLLNGALTGRHAWTQANLLMGCRNPLGRLVYAEPYGWTGDDGSICAGGWGFNTSPKDLLVIGEKINEPSQTDLRRRVPFSHEVAEKLDSGELKKRDYTNLGLFLNFPEELDDLYAPLSGEQNLPGYNRSYAASQQLASNEKVENLLLSYAIPSLSYPIGSNFVDALMLEGNFDMNVNQNQWPESRSSTVDFPGSRWLHSDIREVAFQFTQKVFQKIKVIHEK